MPIWIWFVFSGILISAWMSIYTARKDQKKEQEWIEEEGKKYIERIEQEREKREQEIQQETNIGN